MSSTEMMILAGWLREGSPDARTIQLGEAEAEARGLFKGNDETAEALADIAREREAFRERLRAIEAGEPLPEDAQDYNSRIARMPLHVRRTIEDLIRSFEGREE